MKNETVWYLDCYNLAALGGKDFPVSTFYSTNLDRILLESKKILSKEITGIHKVTIGTNTKGLSPINLDVPFSTEEQIKKGIFDNEW